MTGNSMSNVHMSTDVLSTLLLLQQGNKKFCMASPEAVVQRSSEKKLLLKLHAEFTGKHLCWSLFNKVAGLQTCNFIKKRLHHRCFPVNIPKVLGTVFYRTTLVAAFK